MNEELNMLLAGRAIFNSDNMTSLEPEMVLENDHPYIISPSPVLWMQEMQSCNEMHSPMGVWRELSIRSRQRGTALLKGLEWPGNVVLPSAVIEKIFKLNRILVPDRWREMGAERLSQLIAVLHAWQIERQIFQFTDFAKEIAVNGQMDTEMHPGLFSILPCPAIYLDFNNFDHGSLNLPGGAFVGVDFSVGKSKHPISELIIGIDAYDHIDVFNLPLDGRKTDVVVREAVERYKAENKNAQKFSENIKYLEHHLLTIISAALMSSSNYGTMDLIPEIGDSPYSHKLWTRWGVNKVYNEMLNVNYDRAIKSAKGDKLIVVSEWVNSSKNEVAVLNCKISHHKEMIAIPGLGFSDPVKRSEKELFMNSIQAKQLGINRKVPQDKKSD